MSHNVINTWTKRIEGTQFSLRFNEYSNRLSITVMDQYGKLSTEFSGSFLLESNSQPFNYPISGAALTVSYKMRDVFTAIRKKDGMVYQLEDAPIPARPDLSGHPMEA